MRPRREDVEDELAALEEAYVNGDISKAQCDSEYASIMASYEYAAEEAAEDAYDREYESYGFRRR